MWKITDMKNLNNICLIKKNGQFETTVYPSNETVINVTGSDSFDCICLHFSGNLNLKINLLDKGSSCKVQCVYLAARNEQLNLTIDVTHAAPDTHSEQLIRGLATDSSVVSFNGVIRMPYNSQKCIGNQNHRAILLSEKARIQAVPELEIFADDVQCSHGSAIGPLDKNQIFYMQSRGINKKTAYQLLLNAFIADLIPEEYQVLTTDWMNTYL